MRLITLRAVGDIRIAVQLVVMVTCDDPALTRIAGAASTVRRTLPASPVSIITCGTQRGVARI